MIEINLPNKPKDKYQLNWWRLSISEHWCYIKRMHAIYYIDTPYEELFPGERKGAPLVDSWMIYENNRPIGRWIEWKQPENHPEHWESCFETKDGARDRALRYLKEAITCKKEQIKHLEMMMNNLTLQGVCQVPGIRGG